MKMPLATLVLNLATLHGVFLSAFWAFFALTLSPPTAPFSKGYENIVNNLDAGGGRS